MKFEDLQNQWQKEGGNASIQVSYDMLLKEVSRNQQNFDHLILWRDIQEVVASLFCVCCLLVFSIWLDSWFYPAAGGMFFAAVFFVVYRRFRPKKSPAGTVSLRTCVEESLDEIHCQIKLLNNVFWWYLLVPEIGTIFIFAKSSYVLIRDGHLVTGLLILGGYITGAILLSWWVCWLNRRCVRKDLLPRKLELEELLGSMGNGCQEKPTAEPVNLWTVGIISAVIVLFLSTPVFFMNQAGWLGHGLMDAGRQAALEITPPLLPQESPGPKELKILSARYGAKDKWVDVTGKVADAVCQNKLSIHSGNELAGKDPKFLASKVLEIECLWDGQKKTIRVREGMDLNIPLKSDPNVVGTGRTGITDSRL